MQRVAGFGVKAIDDECCKVLRGSAWILCLCFAWFSCGLGEKVVPTRVKSFVPLSENVLDATVTLVEGVVGPDIVVTGQGIEVIARSTDVPMRLWDDQGTVLECELKNTGDSPLVFDPRQMMSHHGGTSDPTVAEGYRPAYVQAESRELTNSVAIGPGEALTFRAWFAEPRRPPCLAQFTVTRSASDEVYRFGFTLDRG